MTPTPEKAYYRPDEVARILNVSLSTVRRWLARGLILHVHFVGLIRIPRAEVDRIQQEGVRRKVSTPDHS